MVNAQEWLESQEGYNTKEKRTQIKELDVSNQNLEGDLDLTDFTKLEKINITGNLQLGEIETKEEVIIIVSAQEWLEKNYPDKKSVEKIEHWAREEEIEGELIINGFPQLKEILIVNGKFLTELQVRNCSQLTELKCSSKEEITQLEIVNCPNLEYIHCRWNKITELDLSGFPNLKILDCSDNYLTNLDLTNNPKLEYLNISDNDFSEQDLSFLNHLINLKSLSLGNFIYRHSPTQERIKKDIHNRLVGSLKYLQNLTKLEYLNISNTDINNGVECLPKNAKKVHYSIKERPQSRLKQIVWQLDLFTSGKQKYWEKYGFPPKEIKQLIEIGLSAYEYDLAAYLKNEKRLNLEEIKVNLVELREKYNPISWRDIHPKFTPELRKEWVDKGFTREQVKEWVKGGDDHEIWRLGSSKLKPEESDLAKYLHDKGVTPWEANYFVVIEKLREEFDNLDKEKKLQEESKKYSLTTKNFADSSWKKFDFDYQRAKDWVEKGLNPADADFACYLEKKGYEPSQLLTSDLINLRREYSDPQIWLEFRYPTEKRKEVTKLNFRDYKSYLKGNLVIDEWENLEEINFAGLLYVGNIGSCPWNFLPEVTLSNLPKLKSFVANECNIKDLTIANCLNLQKINVSINSLTNLDFLKNLDTKKLITLDITKNKFPDQSIQDLYSSSSLNRLENCEKFNLSANSFHGSLKPLKDLTNLKSLAIGGTDIDGGLEYLPESLEKIYLFNNSRFSSDHRGEESKKSTELFDKELAQFEGDMKDWRDFNSPAQQWLDKNYPKNGVCERKTLRNINQGKKREEITHLNISKQELKGKLRLKGFVKLERLNCSRNQLTDLDLSDCPNLVELRCNDNEFNNLSFLEPVSRLKWLWAQNNQKFSSESLKFLTSLGKLEKLNISNCPLDGSLNPLQNLNKLEELDITNTNINEGLESLPSDCKRLYCNSGYQYKSTKVMKELEKSNCSEGEGDNKCYDLDKWRIDKQNSMIASIIPLERLYVIRGNIKHFVSKWGIKKIDDGSGNTNWYDRLSKLLMKQEEKKTSELRKLQHPNELWKHRWTIYGIQFIGRGSAVAGAVLTFRDQSAIGGGILGIYPFTELVVSKLEENLKNKENKWKEFLTDADNFLNNYNELRGILALVDIESLKKEGVSKALNSLNERIQKFLKIYDKDKKEEEGYGEIDVKELTDEKDELTTDLDNKEKKSEVQGIVDSIKALEEAIIEYRKSSYRWINKKEIENNSKTEDSLSTGLKNNSEEEQIEDNKHHIIELGTKEEIKEDPQEQSSTQAQIEVPPKS